MIAIGEHYLGPEHRNSRISEALGKASIAIATSRPQELGKDLPWVNPIFIVAGSLGNPDFDGIRLGHFSKKEGGLVVEIAVPPEVVNTKNIRDPIVNGLRMANAAAFHFFHDKGMKFSLRDAEDLVSQVEKELEDFA